MFRSPRLLLCSVSATAVAFATPAFAQDQPGTAPNLPSVPAPTCTTNGPGTAADNCSSGEVELESGTAATPANDKTIVVTGTRIVRPNLSSPVPITSIGQQELTNQGQASVGDALNDLPALRSTFSQQNSGRFIGTAGQNILDLRGLGTSRTLVLVNGRRHINSSPGSFDVDVDNIPQDLIERVDVVTGGESAVYGSDAIAGVVNFVLKRNFEGFRIRGQAGVSSRGDRPVDFVSTTFGRNFADGRANVAVNLEYTHAGELFFRDRPRASQVCGFEPVEDTGPKGSNEGATGGTDGIPDNEFVCGIRNPFITVGGSWGPFGDGSSLSYAPNGDLVFSSVPSQNFLFAQNNGRFIGGDVISDDPLGGATIRETGDLAVGRNRYMGNLLAHFDVSDAFKPFIEATFVKQKVYQEGQPNFFQANPSLHDFFVAAFDNPNVPDIRCDNPFVTPTSAELLTLLGDCANPDGSFNPDGAVSINKFAADWGGRHETDTRDTYRIVGGFQGDFMGDWHYEVSANYGHFKSDTARNGELLLGIPGSPAGFSLAVDAVRDSSGNIVCAVNADADPTNDAPGCVPIDVFGEGAASAAAIAYSTTTSHLFQSASQFDLQGFMSGNSGRWFELPGGPVGFSVGLEYRRETAHAIADPISAGGGTFFNAFPEFDPPAFDVKEAFAEVEAPILRDRPFFHELTLSGAARFSDYNTSANHTFAWNGNLVWSPVRDLRLRGNLSRSVRVPTIGDLYSPATANFAFLSDPCDNANISDNPNYAANCAALGVPTTVLAGSPCISSSVAVGDPFINCIANSQTTSIQSSGNPDLKEEVGKSFTLGGVLTPRFIPGFSLSVDYFSIKVTNLIATLGGQTILDKCFGAPGGINNQYCALLFPRNQFGLFQSPALISAGVNFAKQTSRGIDFDMTYRKNFANGHRFDLRGIATLTLERNNYINPDDPSFIDQQLGELGDPKFSGTIIAGYGFGPFDIRWTGRYIGSMTDWSWEDTHSVQGRPPENPDIADRINTGSVFYNDVKLTFSLKKKYEFYLGVDNLFDRMPPLRLTGAGEGSGIYNGIGRFFYAGFTVDLK